MSSLTERTPSANFWQRLSEDPSVVWSLQGTAGEEGGQVQVMLLDLQDKQRGAYWTRRVGEFHSAAVASSLSAVLETSPSVQARYSLSRTAKDGVLRRAKNRNKKLPALLEEALRE